MSDGSVTVERRDDLAVVRLNRPDKLNAIDTDLADELYSHVDALGAEDDIRAVVLTGAGRAFCAGGDLAAIWEAAESDPAPKFYQLAGEFHDAILAIRRIPKIVVAAINGPAAGGGFSLALACDLRVMSAEAYLKVAYTGSGLTMDGGGSHFLPRLVGLGRATELIALDDEVGAARAEEIGLVNAVAAAGEAVHEGLEMANRAADNSRTAVAKMKQLLNRSFDRPLEQQLEAERREIADAAASPEGREGIEAFLEKRDAEFRNL